MLYLKTDHKVA